MLLIRTREGKDAWCSMVYEEQEDVIFNRAAKNLAATSAFLVSHHHCHEVVCIYLISTVVYRIGVIYIVTARFIKNLAWEGIFFVVRDIIACEEDDVVQGESLLNKDCVSMVGIGLMPVVVVSTATSNDDCPILG